MKSYPGGKNGAGVWQTIINQMPPHETYIEAFLGSGAVMRRKRPALFNIGIDIDGEVLAAVKPELTAADLIHADALEWFARNPLGENVLVYADPPYLRHTRKTKADIYRKEFATVGQHLKLLQIAKASKAKWIISGYWSQLYALELEGWRTVRYESQTRRGTAVEWLWCNFREPLELHDYSNVGSDRTQRQRVKRKVNRWAKKLSEMPVIERRAILSHLAKSELTAAAGEVVIGCAISGDRRS